MGSSTHFEQEGEMSEGYNGWSNYPTWTVNLWLSNDEGLYNAATELATTTTATARRSEWDNALRANVADAFKSWVCDELAPDLGASFAADLLGYALDQVDWLEIASAWLADADDDDAAPTDDAPTDDDDAPTDDAPTDDDAPTGDDAQGFGLVQAAAIVAPPSMDHRPVHDPWMTDRTDRDYLAPAARWCIVCARPDREHICTTCTRRADDRYDNPAAGEHCADKVHEPFYSTEYNYETGRAVATDDARAYSKCAAGYRGARQAARSWRAAQGDHGETSYWGAAHIREMRGFWLGLSRTLSEQR